jgi:HD-GYP domain-containing protein (c-di-GMP phosphodiesterase class II)
MLKAKLLTAFLMCIAILLIAYTAPLTHFDLGWKGYVGLLLFLVINVVSESQPLVLPGAQARISTSGLSSYAALALFPPVLAGLSGAIAIFVFGALIERKPLLKWLFNTVQIFITITLAALTFQSLQTFTLNSLIPYNIIALAGAISVYFVVNTLVVSVLLSLVNSTPFWRIWAKNFQWEIVYVAGNVPLALLLVLAYQRLWIAGPLLFLAPVLLLKESYAQYIRLKTTYTETVRTLIKVIEMHDTYTAGHSLRVAEYAKRLASAKNLSVKEAEKVEIAAYLHDLGKVDLAITHLVRKPGKLTPEEKRRVQLHPLVSADIAAQVTYFRGDIERIIRHHHENYNGTGYPHGLQAKDIPIGARIILIADAFDAMTSNRMYRSALDFERVRGEFIKYAGIQFDPELVDLFLSECVRDESMIIPQLEIPYEELLSSKLTTLTVEAVSAAGS